MSKYAVTLPDGVVRLVAGWDAYDVRALRRLVAKVRVDRETGCWVWTRYLGRDGYGNFWWRKNHQSHRASFMLLVGRIQDGFELDHLCRVRACVNPAHLEQVTDQENVLRGISFAAQNAAKTHCVNGHAFDDDNTYWHRGRKRVCRACLHERYLRYRAQDGYREMRREMQRRYRAERVEQAAQGTEAA